MPAPREDVQAALAGIAAAGNDTEALAEAIEKAAFLEETPGEDRQKLRGNNMGPNDRLQSLTTKPLSNCIAQAQGARVVMQRPERS